MIKILIDIGHPSDVHVFKNFAWQMQKNGHKVFFTARDKEHELYLLKTYGFNHISFGKHYKSIIGKIGGLLKFNLLLLKQAINFKPDLFLSHGSIYAAHVSGIIGRPHISLEDTGNMEQIILYRPFTQAFLSPDVLKEDLGDKQIRYTGYHELCYLLPKYFRKQDEIRSVLGLKANEKYIVLRFVSWDATHDFNQKGISQDFKSKLIQTISSRAKVFISSENHLPAEFKEYQINIPPERMHDVLAFADLFVGEGATMASESGVLGTPAIYINSLKRSYCEDQERFGLVYNYQNKNGVLNKINEILSNSDIKKELKKNRDKMLSEKIDVTAFLIWFVENYPNSAKIMKENPDYQYRFR